jgi:hypothetical protein
MYFLYKVALDYDDYERMRYDEVGPFETIEDANKWIDETPEYREGFEKYYGEWSSRAYGNNRYIRVTNPFLYMTRPEDWKARNVRS